MLAARSLVARSSGHFVSRRCVSIAALEAKVTSDEGKQELNRLKMALGPFRGVLAFPRADATGGRGERVGIGAGTTGTAAGGGSS